MKKIGNFWTNILVWVAGYSGILPVIGVSILFYIEKEEINKDCINKYKRSLGAFLVFFLANLFHYFLQYLIRIFFNANNPSLDTFLVYYTNILSLLEVAFFGLMIILEIIHRDQDKPNEDEELSKIDF